MHNMRIPYPIPSEKPHGRPTREPEHVIFQREAAELRAKRRRERRVQLVRRIRGRGL
jgi:hypothetical protein